MSLNPCNSCSNINNNCPAISYWSASQYSRFVDQNLSNSNKIVDSVSYKNFLINNANNVIKNTDIYLKKNFIVLPK